MGYSHLAAGADQSALESRGAQFIEPGGNYAMKIVRRISAVLLCAISVACAGAQQRAASVYKTNCAACHGAVGDANTPAGKAFKVPSFSSEDVLKEPDANLLAIAKEGKGKMPAWHDKLSEDQLKDLIAYIHTLQKKS
jgi:mono/diheme cytochrome c family protein